MSGFAVIFDVDGVLLELTRDEEDVFFEPFATHLDTRTLSRDWNSYAIRNDEDIVREIVARHGLAPELCQALTARYLALLEQRLAAQSLMSVAIPGATELVARLAPLARLGIATANFRDAARLRLMQAGLWAPVASLAFGADGGGPKRAILSRAIAASGLPAERIIFIGDNLNDVAAGVGNGAHFIGFSTSAARLASLAEAGAQHLAGTHLETEKLVRRRLKAAI